MLGVIWKLCDECLLERLVDEGELCYVVVSTLRVSMTSSLSVYYSMVEVSRFSS